MCHYAILPQGAEDSEVLVEEMKQRRTTTERSNPTCIVRSRLSFSGESNASW